MSGDEKSWNRRAWSAVAALVVSAALPLLLVLPFGWLWLWQNGYLPHWLVATLVLSLAIMGLRWWLIVRMRRSLAARSPAPAEIGLDTPREIAAWAAVERMADNVSPDTLASRSEMLALGLQTVETVAREMHPEEADPLWHFTVPEALLLIERVAQQLRPVMMERVPLGDQLTVAQLLRIYRWRGVLTKAEKAYDLWRILRMTNPLAAATQEIRERMSKAVFEQLRAELAARLTRAFVREVGRAAIDLYSGRMRLSEAERVRYLSRHTTADRAAVHTAEPIRILLAGKSGAGKSSLVNAMAEEVRSAVDALPTTREFASYELRRGDQQAVTLIDSPGLEAIGSFAVLAAKALSCDLIVWVAPANQADRGDDREALDAVRAAFLADPTRQLPPVLLVLTHIDRLPPISEWDPPYDLTDPTTPKAHSIRDAMEAAGADLGLDIEDIIAVSLVRDVAHVNVDVVWAKLIEVLPDAKRAQLLRCLSETRGGINWRRAFAQAVAGGRLVTRLFRRRQGGKGQGEESGSASSGDHSR